MCHGKLDALDTYLREDFSEGFAGGVVIAVNAQASDRIHHPTAGTVSRSRAKPRPRS